MRSKSGEQPTVDKLNLGGKQSEKPMVTSGRGPEKEKKALTMAEYIKKMNCLNLRQMFTMRTDMFYTLCQPDIL